ncbi:ATP-binding protein [Roseovarius indicus]|uniref:ATP-binding protein n=1 Tax=Roseovarius indicus TaxID=540747 RepID=UPI00070AE76B|nr:ATP-binding protein [Roseovarius indicus]
MRNCPSAVIVARLSDGRIAAESELARKLMKCQTSRIGHQLSAQWSSRRHFQKLIAQFEQTGVLDNVEARLQKNDGTQFWCAVSARMLRVEEERYIYVHLLDLTDQLTARSEISRQRDALHAAEKLSAIGQLLGGISHELNNPLSVLSGQALMLKEKAPTANVAARADRIINAAERCSRIVRSFLDLARNKPVSPVVTNLNEVVVEAVETTIDALRGAGIDVVLELPKDLPEVLFDPDQLRQVLVNLIVNAQQAMEGAGRPMRITIATRCSTDGEAVLLRFIDTGPGVPRDISSRIFDPLFTTKAPGKGTGLGLALCRRIMEAQGGDIELMSTSARGTSFQLSFRSLAPVSEAGPDVRRRPATHARGVSVLIVHNEEDAAADLADIVTAEGQGVEIVHSAYVAIERLRKGRYDQVFCRAGLGDLAPRDFLRAVEDARPGASAGLVFLLDRTPDRKTTDYLDMVERPYLRNPIRRSDVKEVLELLTLRPAA